MTVKTIHLFYSPGILFPIHTLNEEESKHCVRVLRLTTGDPVFITDGNGTFCEAIITNPSSKACEIKIVHQVNNYSRRNYGLSVAIAPPKNIERFEWFLEKSTEIGIDEITPLICRYSERKEIKTERLEKVIISAMKQSQKAYLPSLKPVQQFKDFIIRTFSGDKFIAHCSNQDKNLLSKVVSQDRNVLILIGPEGDFSGEEVDMAIAQGFIPVSLGESRLRTETAGIVACHTVNLINQRNSNQ